MAATIPLGDVLDQLPFAVAVLDDPALPAMFANTAAHALFGVPDGEPILAAAVLPDFDLAQSQRRVAAAMAGGRFTWRRQVQRPDDRTVEMRFDAIAGQAGLAGKFLVLVTDETASVRREQAVRMLFQQLAATAAAPEADSVLRAMSRGIAEIVGADGCFITRVQADMKAAVVAAHHAGGKDLDAQTYPLHGTACEETLADGQCLRLVGDSPAAGPSPGLVPAGMAYAGVRLTDPRGHSLGHLAVYAPELPDQDNLLDTLRTYASLVAMEMNRQHLEQRQRELQREVAGSRHLEALGRLTGGIAHDFNNLLASVSGNVELAQFDVLPGSPNERRLGAVLEATERMAELCQQLLSYAGNVPLQRRPVDISRLVRDAAEALRGHLGAAVQLDLRLADDLPPVAVDGDQLRLALRNLLANCREAGARHVRISTSSNQRDVDIEVADDGPGMDDATVKQAVEPFWSTHGPGRGLGLPAVVGIAKAHGGQVDIDSRPGGGTRVRLSFRT